MLSVSLPEDEVASLLRNGTNGELSLAAVNGPASCVVSGPAAAVDGLKQQLAGGDVACRVLHTSHAFHSAMMDPIVDSFAELVRKAQPAPASLPCISTVTGTWIS